MVGFERILCPVDFFPASLRAFDYAVRLAANYDGAIHALHVVAPVVPAVYGSMISSADLTAEMEKQSKREFQKLKGKAQKGGVVIDTEVRVGDIDTEIHRAINKRKPGLVVMGTHGRRGFERWVMGSVTERLMRRCPVPLLAISATSDTGVSPPAIRRILVTTDFSEGSADALAYAFSIAQECQARITLLHVIDDSSLANVAVSLRDPLIAAINAKLEELVPAEARTWCEVETRVATGMPYRVILKTLESEKIGLLVMNVHGKGMLDRALIGSTAERVVRAAECPVMLIPPKAAATKTATKKRQIRAAKKKAA